MRQITLSVVAGVLTLAGLTVLAPAVQAQHRHQHRQYHQYLDHRDFQRQVYHYQAHQYPMGWRQHERLHDSLEHSAYHDRLDHRDYHRTPYYYAPQQGGYYYQQQYPSFGFGFQNRNFSIQFGR